MKEIKPVKIITLLGIIWFFTLLAIWRFDNKIQLDDNNDNILIDERQSYEDALKKLVLTTGMKNNNSLFGVKCEYCKEYCYLVQRHPTLTYS